MLEDTVQAVSAVESPVSWRDRVRTVVPVTVALILLALGIGNVILRATSNQVEDGVLWVERSAGVVAAEVAVGSAAERSGLKAGDVLLAVDGLPVEARQEVLHIQQSAAAGERHTYTLLRLDTRQIAEVTLAPIPNGAGALYYAFAAVGIFTLLVGTAVRVRRPRDQATLHFFWLSVAFFGAFAFSFSGRFDRVDWFFYWADEVGVLMLPPLFLHFALVFPERPHATGYTALVARWLPVVYLPAAVLASTRVLALMRAGVDPDYFVRVIGLLDDLTYAHLALYLTGGLAVLVRALGRTRSVTAKRQLRWIVWGTALGGVPFALGYAIPFAFGADPSWRTGVSAIAFGLVPLAFASAIVRYRLMDVEVILKRLLVYTAAVAAIAAFYALTLRASGGYFVQSEDEHRWMIAFLTTVIVVLLARPVKDAVQATIDRAFYRDRYDYRRALVAFARDLNGDLDLTRLAARLVSRVQETLVVDRIALMVANRDGEFEALRADGFDPEPPHLAVESGIGSRLAAGHSVRLDDPLAMGRFTAEEVEFWRDAGVYYFVPCVSNEGLIGVLALGRRESGEPLNSEDMALLAAVAGQAATAIENGRLYRQLQVKATELDRLSAFNENILESLDDGLVVLGLDERVVRWNQALARLHGISSEAALGQPLEQLFEPRFVEALRAARRERPQGAALFRMPLTGRDARDGQHMLVNVTMAPLLASSGLSVESGTIVIIEDITERTQMEEQLRISEKMASLGLLAAGVAHEVNTPLTGISSYTQMLLEGADPENPQTQLLEKIEKQTFRAARIVNGLLNLSRPTASDALERQPVDVNVVVGDVLSLLEHQFEKGSIKVRRELCETPVQVLGFEFKLQQVFLNLFLNARDAMPSGGWLTIATRREGGEVLADVSDTGTGIPPELLARIYDPFFTTKAIGQGTGLGLSITYGIVREHEATIHCESAAGKGTRFTLRFPVVPGAGAIVASPRQQGVGR